MDAGMKMRRADTTPHYSVILANAGIHFDLCAQMAWCNPNGRMDSRLRGNDGTEAGIEGWRWEWRGLNTEVTAGVGAGMPRTAAGRGGGLALRPPPHSVILAKAGIHFDLCAPIAALKN
ncbi:hypothetical protein EAO82_15625 [Halopseudomonas pelagia]|uniref:Uncharacterized protein n=1 Tax=Halopseudomonas pelagia TaxID=553151 RepID=A0AA91U2K4_9GAMM|nr:hypothetical protein CO192_11485 [Halopseudomonas pelagia]QFY57671.1 hypothetical protein EAO82_15625 [Halopseudomonas pelagia]